MGFLGGFSWTVLCAHVCQRFPNATALELIRNFFDYYVAFNWKENYVTIDVTPKISYKMDQKRDLLSVVTFFRPCKNAARNITKSTLTIIKQEFTRAQTILKHKSIAWSLLLRSSEFFTTYKSYIKIVASAVSDDEFFKWSVALQHSSSSSAFNIWSFPLNYLGKDGSSLDWSPYYTNLTSTES